MDFDLAYFIEQNMSVCQSMVSAHVGSDFSYNSYFRLLSNLDDLELIELVHLVIMFNES